MYLDSGKPQRQVQHEGDASLRCKST